MITCSNCQEETDDKESLVDCSDECFDSLKPDLTRWMDGLTAYEKSQIIRSIVKDHIEKEKAYQKHEQEAKASCCASHEELRIFRPLF